MNAQQVRRSVAEAIYGAAYRGDRENRLTGQRFPEPGWCWERAGEVQQQFAQRQASAAIAAFCAAIEEPSEAMCDEGLETGEFDGENRTGSRRMAREVWRAMLAQLKRELEEQK